MISSTPTGTGPNVSTTRWRSSSSGGGVEEKSGGSSNETGSGSGCPISGAICSTTSRFGYQDRAFLQQPVGAGGARVER
jgi:hypothetical protein